MGLEFCLLSFIDQCTFSEWRDVTSCSATCGGGSKIQNRTVVSYHSGCEANSTRRIVACNEESCPCVFGQWSAWSNCSASCGGGHRSRKRSFEGNCATMPSGKSLETGDCNTAPCPTGEKPGLKVWLVWNCVLPD